MMGIAYVTGKYQLTVPKEIREALHLEGGDRILFQINKDGETKIRVLKNVSVDDLAGSLGRSANKPVDYIPVESARQKVAEELAEKINSKITFSKRKKQEN